MNILSFSRMKIFRKDGRVRAILKLRLPHISSEFAEASDFNGFYERLAEEYITLLPNVPYSAEQGSRPTTVAVDFSVINEEYLKEYPRLNKLWNSVTVIKRDVKINKNGEICHFSHIDIYNAKTQTFVK